MSKNQYSKLYNYISYFEDDTIEFCKWHGSEKFEDDDYSMPNPIYDEKFREFIQDVYNSGIMIQDYINVIHHIGSNNEAIQVINDTNDVDTLRAVLTYFVRQERFCEGSWAEAAENKIFLNLLLKLRELTHCEKGYPT